MSLPRHCAGAQARSEACRCGAAKLVATVRFPSLFSAPAEKVSAMNKEQRKSLIRDLVLGTDSLVRCIPALIPASPGWRVVMLEEPDDPDEVAQLAVHTIAAWLQDDLGQLNPLLFDDSGHVFVLASRAGARVVALVAPGFSVPFEVTDIYKAMDLPAAEPSVQ
jgi:hypothetical protein